MVDAHDASEPPSDVILLIVVSSWRDPGLTQRYGRSEALTQPGDADGIIAVLFRFVHRTRSSSRSVDRSESFFGVFLGMS